MALGPEDRAHLDWARALGRRGWGRVHPNPMVGCVLVRDGKVVGQGYHDQFGGPHAEIVALEQALSRAEGSTAYVSLEPCDHDGKTPPCSRALVQAGVRRVVFGAADPDPKAAGGAQTLRAAGIDVVGPVLSESEGRADNPAFFHTARHASPFVALKLALSLDGRIAAEPGTRTRLTGIEADREVHRLRTGFDAVMIGAGTARSDDPRLTVRLVPPGRTPTGRIVLDPTASLPSTAALLEGSADAPVHVFVQDVLREAEIERIEGTGAHVHPVAGATAGLDIHAVLGIAWGIGLRSILCEGGGRLAGSLLAGGHVHRLYLFYTPRTLGPLGLDGFGAGAAALDWTSFEPAHAPEMHGRDALVVLDRQGD